MTTALRPDANAGAARSLAARQPVNTTPDDAAAGQRVPRPDDAVLRPAERLMVFVLWILLSGAPSLLTWALTGYFGYFYSPMLWLFVLGVSQPYLARIVGRVDAFAALPADPAVPHLDPELERMAVEAAEIRDELDLAGLERSLGRAWILANEFARLPYHLRTGRERSHAALAPVQALVDLRAEPGPSRLRERQQRDRLAAALADFTATLREPPGSGFR